MTLLLCFMRNIIYGVWDGSRFLVLNYFLVGFDSEVVINLRLYDILGL